MCSKLISIDSDINKAFIFMHQNMAKTKKYAYEIWIVLDEVMKHSIKIFEC